MTYIPMIYLFYGDDTYSLAQAIKNLKTKFVKENSISGVEKVEISDDRTDESLRTILQELLQSQGLFSRSKLVILQNFLEQINKFPKSEAYLLGALSNLGKEAMIVFVEGEAMDKRKRFFKALYKMARNQEFVYPKGSKLVVWIKDYLASQGFRIEDEALQKLLSLLGESERESMYNLWQVSGELEKLMLYRFAEKFIRLSDVTALVPANIDHNIFTLTNLFAAGETPKALNTLESMVGAGPAYEQKSQVIQIVGGLASQIRSLLLVKDLESHDTGEIAKILNWKEGRVWINMKLAAKFTKGKLITLLSDLKALDFRLKTSEEPPKLLLALFFQKAKV